MKLRSTTLPASISKIVKSGALSVLVLAILATVFVIMKDNVFANNAQIQGLEREINRLNTEASRLAGEAETLQGALNIINNDVAAIEAKVNLSQERYDLLVVQIAQTEKDIESNRSALGKTIVDLYAGDNVSPIEMLASSQNIGDFIDKQEYRVSVQDNLSKTIKKINKLREELKDKQAQVKVVLDEQKGQQNMLVQKRAEQHALLEQTKGDEASFRAMSSKRSAELQEAHRQQQEAINKITGGGQNTAGKVGPFEYRNYSGNQGSCGGGYPQKWCTAPLDAYVDNWALYSRECVSYTAWAAETRFGKKVESFRGMGHAYQWPNTASSLMGANVNNSPAVGAVAITPRSNFTPLGHAMVVEAILGDGWVRVSQYNFAGTGEYSTMDLRSSSAQYVHFKNR